MRRLPHAHAGFATIVALFLLVVLAGLGAFMVSISTTQQVGAAQDVQGTRAYWAAQAGLAWAVGSLTASPVGCPTPPAPFTVDGFSLDVRCSSAAFDEAGTTRKVYALTARASLGSAAGSPGFVERSVSASVEF